jgi:predicted nuclease of predicted toxin-antitoxin system
MRLLLDECVPKRLKDDLAGHDVSHAVVATWKTNNRVTVFLFENLPSAAPRVSVDR